MGKLGLQILFFTMLSMAIVFLYLYRDLIDFNHVQAWVARAGVWGALLFMGLYALLVVFLFPGLVTILIGGALFGPVYGTLYNVTAATLGAVVAFLISRYLAGAWFRRRTRERYGHILDGVERSGWRFIALVRLIPFMPFNLLNYAFGLAPISLFHYLVVTWICLLPSTLAYTYLGHVGAEALSGGEDLLQKGMLALGFMIMVGYLPRLVGLLGLGLNMRSHHSKGET